jgi:signal transduction histidine kinase
MVGKDDVSQLLHLTVHEFRTPVSVVAGYIRMLLRDMAGPLTDRQRKLLEEAERSSARLAALVAELGDLANLDGTTAEMPREEVDVFRLLAETAATLHEGSDRGVRLEVRCDDPGSTGDEAGSRTVGNSGRLARAFGSIITAIAREKADPGVVVIAGSVRDIHGAPSALVVVADESRINKLLPDAPAGWTAFEEWRGGMGLALPMARRIIEAHGGSMWSPSETDVRGAAAWALPLKETK